MEDARGPGELGVAILMILPAWNHYTLGDWRRDPYPHYSRVYFRSTSQALVWMRWRRFGR